MMINKNNTDANEINFSFYSKVLKQPFDTIDELKEAEAKHAAELKAKEDKAAQKKADAQKVEEAFKTLNATRKAYKEGISQLTTEYAEALANLKKTFEVGKTDLQAKLAKAEENYSTTLNEFTTKYDSFHMTLKDGDFETTISGNCTTNPSSTSKEVFDIFDLFFNF